MSINPGGFTTGQTVCSGCELGSVCLCSSLPIDERLQLIDEVSKPASIAAGDHLYRAGDSFSHFFALKSGHTKTYAHNSSGEDRVVAFHMAGDTLGLEALCSDRHNVSAVALTDISLCRIAIRSLNTVSGLVPELQRLLLAMLSRDIASHHQWLVTENLRAERRVASFLFAFSEKLRARNEDALKFALPMRRADVGSYLNLAHETVTRILAKLSRQKIIATHRRNTTILDPAALRKLAEG